MEDLTPMTVTVAVAVMPARSTRNTWSANHGASHTTDYRASRPRNGRTGARTDCRASDRTLCPLGICRHWDGER